MKFKYERGYLIWVANRGHDYTKCAMALAQSIRYHTPDANIALVSEESYTNPLFDECIQFDAPIGDNPFAAEAQLFRLSPFRETIKIEADMIVPHSIDHWWTMFERRDVVLTVGARNWKNDFSNVRDYRKIFDANDLPDIYNAVMYWRFSRTAAQFFDLVGNLFANWKDIRETLKFGHKDTGTSDVVYAVAAKMFGAEQVTLPNTTYPSLIHMKGRFNNLTQEDWRKELTWELDGSNIRINTIDQQYPFHYVEKEFAEVLNEHFRSIRACRTA